MIMQLQKLGIFDFILYEIYGNIDLYEDCDDKENFLLGSVGLISLPEEQFPQIIPHYSLMKEILNALKYLVEEIERNENFKEEEVEDENKSDLSDDKSWIAED